MTERTPPNMALMSLMAGLAGAGLALLFAPRSGKETRDDIAKRTAELKHQAEDRYRHVKDSVASGVEKTRDSLGEALSTTTRVAREQYDEMADKLEK